MRDVLRSTGHMGSQSPLRPLGGDLAFESVVDTIGHLQLVGSRVVLQESAVEVHSSGDVRVGADLAWA